MRALLLFTAVGPSEISYRGIAVREAEAGNTWAAWRNMSKGVFFLTDEGLEHIATLKGLDELGISHTDVTKEGVEKLQRALPNTQIRSTARWESRSN